MTYYTDWSENVQDYFGPVLRKDIQLTDEDLLKFNAIFSWAAWQAKEIDETVVFSEAADYLGISKFESIPALNPDNNEPIFYDAWWASNLNHLEWLELAYWSQQQLSKQQMIMRISVVAFFLTSLIPTELNDSFQQWRKQNERGLLIQFWRKQPNYLEALKSNGKSSNYLHDLATALNEVYNEWRKTR
jgi:hypothetical protein